MRFRILGPLDVWDGAHWRSLGAPKWRALLATLLIRSDRPVSVSELIEELWEGEPPRGAVNLVHGYVARIRRAVRDDAGQLLISRSPGYHLRLSGDDVDARRFEALAGRGVAAQAAGDSAEAAELLRQALDLWRGPALIDVPPTVTMQIEANRLEETRLTAVEARIDAELARGRHLGLVPELQRLTTENPLREHLWAQWMVVLYRSGRQSEALEAYRRLYALLDAEHGIEPGPRVRELHQQILANDPALAPDPRGVWEPGISTATAAAASGWDPRLRRP